MDWGFGADEADDAADVDATNAEAGERVGGDAPVASADLQGGTISVYEDRVEIDRSKRSMFEDKTVPMDEIYGVDYDKGFVTGHVQVQQVGVDHGSGGLFSHPVDENTLYFPRKKRAAARELRDAILARATASTPG